MYLYLPPCTTVILLSILGPLLELFPYRASAPPALRNSALRRGVHVPAEEREAPLPPHARLRKRVIKLLQFPHS